MGKVLIPGGGGGGVSSDDVTVKQSDVPVGLTTVTSDSDDEIVEGTLTTTVTPDKVLKDETFYNTETHQKESGTMANQGAVSQYLNCGESYTIPVGYHNGSGKITANSLSSQTGVQSGKSAITASQVLTGYEGWVNGNRITGSMANQGAKTHTFTPSGSQQTYNIPAGYHDGNGKVVCNARGSFPYYDACRWWGDNSYWNKSTSFTVSESGYYFIHAQPFKSRGDWTVTAGSSTLYSGGNAWFNWNGYLNANTTVTFTAYEEGGLSLVGFKYKD